MVGKARKQEGEAAAESHLQPDAESSGHRHHLLSLLPPFYSVRDPMPREHLTHSQDGSSHLSERNQSNPRQPHRRPVSKVILDSAKRTLVYRQEVKWQRLLGKDCRNVDIYGNILPKFLDV